MEPRLNGSHMANGVNTRFAVKRRGNFISSVRMKQRKEIAICFMYCSDDEDAMQFCTEGAAFAFVAALAHHHVSGLKVVEVLA